MTCSLFRKPVVMADRILGCPHEEGVDYPDGPAEVVDGAQASPAQD
jgi:hypothetical protein